MQIAEQTSQTMPIVAPIRASNRDPKRARPIPQSVRNAVMAMICGNPDAGDDAAPLSFVAAAKLAQIRPPTLRRWLDRPEVIALIRAERAAFRRLLCCGNELALANIRDHGANDAARVRSVLALEAIDMQDTTHRRGEGETAGITIVISSAPPPSPRQVVTIDADAEPIGTIEHRPIGR